MVRRLFSLSLFALACSPELTTLEGTPPPTQPGVCQKPTADSWPQLDQTRASALQSKLDQAVADLGVPGSAMGIAYHGEPQIWTGASGLADRDQGEAWGPQRQFRIGSVTKTFTTAGIFQLIDEGVLSLDDPLEQWVPGYYDGRGVTIRHLLTNTSGIVNYAWIGEFNEQRSWEPRELVEWAVVHGPELKFQPGTQWDYSNTNFVLLGFIIEAAAGQSYNQFLVDRFFTPLGLCDTYLASGGDTNERIVESYDLKGVHVTVDPSYGWSAGSIVSTPHDLARWGAALFGGDLLSEASMAQMLTPVPVSGEHSQGHGVFVELDGDDGLYGHTGGIGGFKTYLYYWKSDGIALAVVSNGLNVNLRDLSAYGWSVVLDFEFP